MFAVIKTGGKQYKVEKGLTIEIEKLEGKEGDSINFDQVLLISDSTGTKVGTPTISGAVVSGKLVDQKRGEKIVVFKMKAKKRYQKTQGHRQDITVVEITEVKASGGKTPGKTPAKTTAKKAEPKTEPKAEKTPTEKAPAKVKKD